VRDFLRSVVLFKDLDEAQLARLEGQLQEEVHPAKRVIFREGDPVDAFYVVREGLVTVFRETPGKPLQVLARLEAGGFFGEMGLLNDKARRFASARTTLPTTLLRLDKQDLLGLLAGNPALELRFRAEVIKRHGMNVSALLALAGQRDVRIRLGVEAEAELPDGSRLEVTLENLSLGGVGLSGVPASWRPGEPVRFALARRGEPSILDVVGTVSWREADGVGIAFDPGTAGDASLIYRVLRRFLESRQ
jgi:CRP-like cAMP-binding protein